MRLKGLVAVLGVVLVLGSPLASARTLDLPSGTVTLEAAGPGGTQYDYDNAGFTCSPPSGHTFPLGSTDVSCTDSESNPVGGFTVAVSDTIPPVVTPPGNVSVNTGNPGGTTVTYGGASASDAVAGSPTVNCSPASGSNFGVGTTTVTCSASDGANTGSATFTVTVNLVDETPPVVHVPADITAEATGPGGASVSFTVTATDDVDSSPTVSCNHSSGTFPIGSTTVTCGATDDSGNAATQQSFTITVRDTTGPTINVPANITTPATGLGGAAVNYGTVNAVDLVDGTIAASCSPPSGATFGVGTSTVTCNAEDSRGNDAAPKSFNITVQDNAAPSVTVPSNQTAQADSPGGRHVTYPPATATDNVDGTLTPNCSPASGALFGFGETTVTCSATDNAGNTGSASFKVTVVDTTLPSLTLPGNQTVEATSPSGATVAFAASATDLGASIPVNCNPGSGSTFAIQTTTVNCSANDGHGNIASGSFNVIVRDTMDPSLNLPANQTVEATSPSGAAVSFNVSATDLGQAVPVSCNRVSGSTFAITTTTVNCTANDGRGNTTSGSFQVTVRDTVDPVLNLPGNQTVEATSTGGAGVSFTATATDLGASVSVNCTPPSGSTFAIKATTVNCTANDGRGNTTSGSFTVTVVDTTDPVLSNIPADITVEANGPTGSLVNFPSPTAVDLGTPIPAVPCTPASGSTFPLGETTVNCSANDGRGNSTSGSFKVKVVDTTPPVLIPPGDTSVYANTETGSYFDDQGPIIRFLRSSFVQDIADPSPAVHAEHPAFLPVGTTTVTFTATDASGNKATGTAKLTVLPKPAPGTTPPPLPPPRDNRPPGNVRNPTVKAGDGRAIFRWLNPTDADFDHTEITRTTTVGFKSTQATGTVVYQGKGTTYTDRRLQNGVEYRYVIASVDKSGNKSAGVAAVVVPRRALLRTPADGSKLNKLPTQFVWTRDPRATYYNFQLYAGGTLLLKTTTGRAADPKKILSVFPTGTSYKFKSPWRWEGRTYKMTKGVYTWYVFPGYGAREAGNYGRLMGAATFQVTKVPKPPKKPPKKKR